MTTFFYSGIQSKSRQISLPISFLGISSGLSARNAFHCHDFNIVLVAPMRRCVVHASASAGSDPMGMQISKYICVKIFIYPVRGFGYKFTILTR